MIEMEVQWEGLGRESAIIGSRQQLWYKSTNPDCCKDSHVKILEMVCLLNVCQSVMT